MDNTFYPISHLPDVESFNYPYYGHCIEDYPQVSNTMVPIQNFEMVDMDQPVICLNEQQQQPAQTGFEYHILADLPEKNRVETQIKLCLKLIDKNVQLCKNYNYLVVDDKLLVNPVMRRELSKKKKLAQADAEKELDDHTAKGLLLDMSIMKSDGSFNIERCYGCVQREQRGLLKKIQSKNIEVDSLNIDTIEEEKGKILQIYSEKFLDFSSGEIIIPSRITCYCRHHKEDTGFLIHISMIDIHTGVLVSECVTQPIMITDDHKNTGGVRKRKRAVEEEVVLITKRPKSTINTLPCLEKIIPERGPTFGGIEVTFLGNSFYPSLDCYFGENRAVTRYWGDTTLIAVLPPSISAGAVTVSLRDPRNASHNLENLNGKTIFFVYEDDTQLQLLELALQVIGMKLTGTISNPTDIARQIVDQSPGGNTYQPTNYTLPQHYYGINPTSLDINVINALHFSANIQSDYPLNFSLQNEGGHQILHLAIIENSINIFNYLMTLDIDLNLADFNGLTPLHFATMYQRDEMTKVLLKKGALTWITDEFGNAPNIPENLLETSEASDSDFNNFEDLDLDESSIAMEVSKEQQAQENSLKMVAVMLWAFIKSVWSNYRIFVYIGLLLTTGAWTVIDYLPLLYSDSNKLQNFDQVCNPPTAQCTFNGEQVLIWDIEARGSRSLTTNLSTFIPFLIYGQFTLFIITLFLILMYFRESISQNVFWILSAIGTIIYIFGALSIFFL